MIVFGALILGPIVAAYTFANGGMFLIFGPIVTYIATVWLCVHLEFALDSYLEKRRRTAE